MMVDFMGDYIGLGEIVVCVYFVFYLLEEGCVEIDVLIGGVVKWFYC